jgi:hypothetical protein
MDYILIAILKVGYWSVKVTLINPVRALLLE